MLSKNLKRVGAILPATAILFSSAAIPAGAKTATTVTRTETVISENFNSYAVGTSQVLGAAASDFDSIQNIRVKKSVTWGDTANYPDGMKATIESKDGSTGDNYFNVMTKLGARMEFNRSDSAEVKPGDIITVNFKYKYDAKQGYMRVNLNDISRSNFVYKAHSGDYCATESYASEEGKARILKISMGDNRLNETENLSGGTYWYGPQISLNTWNEVTITIDTANEEYGAQTLKVQSGNNWFIGLYDADYTGDGDTTYNVINSINSLSFDTYEPLYGNNGETTPNFMLDDILVTVTGQRTEYQSDLNTTIINEDFSNLTVNNTSNGWTMDIKKELSGTSFKFSTFAGGGTESAGYPDATDGEKALKVSAANDHAVTIYADADKTLAAGDILNLSFDYYQKNQNDMYVMLQGLQDKGIAYQNIKAKNWYNIGAGTVTNGWQSPKFGAYISTADNVALLATTGTNGKSEPEDQTIFTPIAGHSGTNPEQRTFLTDKWYTVEISIDTANDAFDGKQTMSMKYKERGTDTYIQEFIGYFDADATTIGTIDTLTEFKGFDIGITTANSPTGGSCEAYIDNVKASVQRPGYEIWGAASDGHETDGKFTAGQNMSIKAAADPALLKTVTKNDNGAVTAIEDKSVPMMLAAALYDSEGRLMGVKLANKTLSTTDTTIETDEFDTTGIAKVRTFLWEESNIAPYLNFGEFTAASN